MLLKLLSRYPENVTHFTSERGSNEQADNNVNFQNEIWFIT